ncbi:MAG: VWA domain-containing protein [Planctomycetes bacterium]|nr:VWA domain-containing protein [Planctomycetota bacterium]
MMVTPRIVVRDDSEAIGMDLPGIFSADLDIPFRQSAGDKDLYSGTVDRPFQEFPAEPPIVYPDAEIWEELSRNRVEGQGPGQSGDRYSRITENPFQTTLGEGAVSTFSIDVDTASYANVRQFLLQNQVMPPPDAVRIEELVNYFDYDYEAPTSTEVPFAAHVEVAACPWQPKHRLVRVALKGREVEKESRPLSNLVFLLDVSGSMNDANKLPLLKQGMKMLAEQLGENDRVAIVVYASSEGLALPSTPGTDKETILDALDRLAAGGSTAGGAGIRLAYQVAKENFISGGVNRVILCTDGDFNVGTTSTAELERLVEEKASEGTFLTLLGFGRGNLNDAMMENISNKGNGNYHYIDSLTEAQKVLVEEMGGTLVTIAKDVKIQVEFNPTQVAAYRLIGYENRMLAARDFNDDKKDAGEIGAGHKVTAMYEIVPQGKEAAAKVDTGDVDELKYQTKIGPSDAADSGEMLELRLRYKQPDGDTSTKIEFPVTDSGKRFARASKDFKFASSVASFGMLLRNSQHKGDATYAAVLEIATEGKGADVHGYRAEFLQLVEQAKKLAGE